VIKYLNRLSALLFYLLGTSFFLAYLLHENEVGGGWPLWFINIADLPLAVVAMLYGGLSLYRSVTRPNKVSWVTMVIIGIPLIVVFGLLVMLNYSA
jgi:hypothetical protein